MNILILNPPFIGKFSRTSRSPAVTKGGTIYYPFWLAYAAGVLEQNGFCVKLIDAPAQGWDMDAVFSHLSDWQPDLAVIDTSTPSIYEDVKSAEKIKQRFSSCFICLVGTHPSALPEETLKLSDKIDAIARREYDYTLLDLAKALDQLEDLSSVLGLSFRRDGTILHNQDRPFIENLDDLPFASQVYKQHLDIRKYFFAAAEFPMVMIITGRGCPHRCFFCVYPQTFHGRRYRFRSPENVVAEFEYIVKNLPEVKEIGIEDDTFTANRQRTREICKLLIERRLKIKWYCNVRVDLDFDTMRLMKQAGCRLVTVGFESANQQVLNNIHKGVKVEQIKQFVRDTNKARILVHGCFMAGNPGDTKSTLKDNLRLAKQFNCDSMQFYPLLVYPGTEAYDWAKRNNYILTEDYAKWANREGGYNCIIRLPELSEEEIVTQCNQATKEYFLRPHFIFKKLLQILTHPSEIKRTFMAAITFFRYLKSTNKKETSVKQSWNQHWGADKTRQRLISFNLVYPEVVRLLLGLTNQHSRCIELGCGSGTYALALSVNNRNCIASDYSQEALDLTKSRAKELYNINIPTELIDIYNIPYPDDSFDLVFSDGVLEHLDIPRALREIRRIVKPNGWVITKVPSGSWLYRIVYYLLSPQENRPFEAWYSKRKWAGLMQESGLKDIEVSTCGSIINGLAMRSQALAKFNNYAFAFGRIYYLIKAQK